jgi:hypothetical protein
MTRLLTAAPIVRRIRPNTDILVQPYAATIRQTHPVPQRRPAKRKINYAKKIMNDDFLMYV